MVSCFAFFLIGEILLYNVVLVSVIQQCKSALIIPMSLPSSASLPPYYFFIFDWRKGLGFNIGICRDTSIQSRALPEREPKSGRQGL